jgi:glutamine amidotransferase-like uncharacterized protein
MITSPLSALLRRSVQLALIAALAAAPAVALGQEAQVPVDEINGGRLIFPEPSVSRPIQVAIYEGPGSGAAGIRNVENRIKQLDGAEVVRLSPEEMGTRDLSGFDLVVFSGGSGSGQSKAIGDAGRDNVRKYVEQGGAYMGVCAGAYLACAGFEWGLGILNARTVSSKWRRGMGHVEMELTGAGRSVLGEVSDRFLVRYANGPIITPLGRDDLPEYSVLAHFRTELAENGSPVGVMVDSPAAVVAPFGKGRVLIFSPHPENTPGLDHVIPRAVAHLMDSRHGE